MAVELDKIVERTFSSTQWRTFRTLIAVSGGPDSVALLRLIVANADAASKSNLIVAHINHGTRAEQSDADADFVRQLADTHQLEFCLDSILPIEAASSAIQHHSEESLRNARYDRLVEMAGRLGCRYLVTGHHLDDQIETVLFRIFRGTGIAGLQGIPERRVVNGALTILRPLLSVRSGELKNLFALNRSRLSHRSNERGEFVHSQLFTQRNFALAGATVRRRCGRGFKTQRPRKTSGSVLGHSPSNLCWFQSPCKPNKKCISTGVS